MAAGSKFWINKLHPPTAVTVFNETAEVGFSEFIPFCVIIKAPLCQNFRSEDLRTLNNASSEFNMSENNVLCHLLATHSVQSVHMLLFCFHTQTAT